MPDRLSALLQRFELHARVFYSGALCGIADFDGGTGVGHLHLVRRGPLGVTDTLGRHSVVSEPSVLFFPCAGAHRLTEVLVIQLLRHAIAHQLVDGGVMAGLADPRLAKAISALHADPARTWTLDAMAGLAGMSRARFAAHFTRTVGMPPGDYLTGWRLGLARTLLRKGLAVKQVAAEVGYASPGAFGRVFLQRLDTTPTKWQHRDAGARP